MTKYNEPEIEGVVICCRGAENGETTLNITNAVQALFDVPVHKIVILEAINVEGFMKKVFGRNRLAIIALAVMIGVAGYMSFADAGKDKKKPDKKEEKQVEVLNYEDLTDGAVSENADLVKEENTDTAAGEDVADAGNAL